MLVVVLLASALTACGPVRRGVTGMTLDAAGRPAVAVAWCPGRPPDSVVLYEIDGSTPDATVVFDGPKPSGTYAEIPLTALPPRWTTSRPDFTIAPAREYRAYAVVSSSEYTTDAVHFTLERLRPRGAARILARTGRTTSSGDEYELLTVPEFRRLIHQRGMC